MKLEVGMYVRFKDKRGNTYIRKIVKLADEYPQKLYGMEIDVEANYSEYLSTRNVYKASHNLLGNDKEPCLIEVGDYVNGHKVYEIREDIDDYGNDFKEVGIESDSLLNHYVREVYIKSIVTKEQFESMSYRVEE